ncbi:MAG TPA: type II secretion system F family protein [Candidatus Eisenbacteria bacterium]|nr:type II secretion system F family protein [Candidatus Eisenbacteria bacterium]
MATYRYRALAGSGGAEQGVLEADDLDGAIGQIHAMGLTPVRVEAKPSPGAGVPSFKIPDLSFLKPRVPTRELILFTRQLETMLDAGLPLVQALGMLRTQSTCAPLREAIDQVVSDVSQGSTLTEAMGRHRRCFPELYVSLVHAGEEGGLLTQMLDRIAVILEYGEETEQRLRSATFYPMVICIELVVAFLVLVKFVLPRFSSLFKGLGADLPLPTRLLIGVSDFFEARFFLLLFGAVAGATAWIVWSRTPGGRARIDRWILAVPIFGVVFQKLIVSRFIRVLSALLGAGIPVVQALSIARGVLGNKVVEAEVDRMSEGVVGGQGLTQPLRGSRVFPPLVVEMVGVGEETGALDKLLARGALYLDRDVDYALKNLSSALEPILLVVLGVGILFTALAVFLPLWNLMSAFRH